MARSKGSKTHCSKCGGEGHTKRTCGKKDDITPSYEPLSYRGRSPYRRKSCCSYCKHVGHTKRTCVQRSNDLENAYKANSEFRTNFFHWMEANKIGVGSVVVNVCSIRDNNEIKKVETAWIITKIRWENINICMSSYTRCCDRKGNYIYLNNNPEDTWRFKTKNWYTYSDLVYGVFEGFMLRKPLEGRYGSKENTIHTFPLFAEDCPFSKLSRTSVNEFYIYKIFPSTSENHIGEVPSQEWFNGRKSFEKILG